MKQNKRSVGQLHPPHFHVLNNNVQLLATILDSAHREYSHHSRRFYWAIPVKVHLFSGSYMSGGHIPSINPFPRKGTGCRHTENNLVPIFRASIYPFKPLPMG